MASASESRQARSTASLMPSGTPALRAFTGGLSTVTTATRSRTSYRTSCDMARKGIMLAERQVLHLYTLSDYHGVAMALNLKNAEVERLAAEIARLTGETKTEAMALEERRQRLKGPPTARRRARALAFLRTQVWPTVPADQRGRRLSRKEEDEYPR